VREQPEEGGDGAAPLHAAQPLPAALRLALSRSGAAAVGEAGRSAGRGGKGLGGRRGFGRRLLSASVLVPLLLLLFFFFRRRRARLSRDVPR